MARQIQQKKKVFVGVSGGVDSSVAAALLKKRGYNVTGVFIKSWQPDFAPCSWREDRLDAMRVCAHLNIPFLTFDFEKEYKQAVVDYMISEYRAGKTPNPDVMCNKYVKFGVFLEKAMEEGADYVATGHYARLTQVQLSSEETKAASHGLKSGNNENKASECQYELRLLRSKDKNKDQTYFLWTLTQKQLENILFPIGDYTKREVRKMAGEFGLITAGKKDSQGICFMGELNIREFLKHFIAEKQGNVLDKNGEIVGYHMGAHLYTLGQRHGFVITKHGTNDSPRYVIAKDVQKNTITVSDVFDPADTQVFLSEVAIREVNWISKNPPAENKRYLARIRYRQEPQSCVIKNIGDKVVKIVFDNPQKAVTPGQSLVVYDKEICLGGGVIAGDLPPRT
jgi:tRNA-specific 2-thiouridylase